jgi:hypothetical protein
VSSLFDLQDLGAKDLKGLAEPAPAWVALRPSAVESRFEALRTATTPLVGRNKEIEVLTTCWVQAKAGNGSVVLISGEPGIGKSRLAEVVQERLGTEPHTRVRFFCSPYHQDSALYPAIAQLERAAGFRREDVVEQRLTKLEALLARATNDVGGVARPPLPATASRHGLAVFLLSLAWTVKKYSLLGANSWQRHSRRL